MKLPTDFRVKKKSEVVKKTPTKFISEKEEPLKKAWSIAYDKAGLETLEDKFVCKHVRGDKNIYYVLVHNGSLYDVRLPLPRKREYRQVNKKCYDTYLNFVQTKEHHFYEKAVRAYSST